MNINRVIVKLSPAANRIFQQLVAEKRRAGVKDITHDEILALATEARRQAGEIK